MSVTETEQEIIFPVFLIFCGIFLYPLAINAWDNAVFSIYPLVAEGIAVFMFGASFFCFFAAFISVFMSVRQRLRIWSKKASFANHDIKEVEKK